MSDQRQSPPNPQTNNESHDAESCGSTSPSRVRAGPDMGEVGQGSGPHLEGSGSPVKTNLILLHLSGSTIPDIGLHLGTPSGWAGPIQTTQEIHIWPHLEARVTMPQLPLQERPRVPSPPRHPFITELMEKKKRQCEKKKWQCAVCGDMFLIVSALCGHMKVHKNRGWKGINPPPGFRCPFPGSRIGGNYPSPVSSDLNCELTLGLPRPQIPRPPALQNDYGAIAARMDKRERERVLGKRPAPSALGESSKPQLKSERPIEGGVKDLNDAPPSDKCDEGPLNKDDEGGEAGDNNAT